MVMVEQKHDVALAEPGDLRIALALLTRLPLPAPADFSRGARAAWAYPLAGAILGLLAATVASLLLGLGVPGLMVAALTLATLLFTTGALHEDGLADTVDGLWGGWDRKRRLEIMKDSRIGAYGVLALTLSVLTRLAGLWTVIEADLSLWLVLPMVFGASRGAMLVPMSLLPHARADGLARQTGRVPGPTSLLGLALSGLLMILAAGWGAFGLAFWVIFAAAGLTAIARAKIGGQTGDILGATQQLAEVVFWIVLAAQIAP